MDGRAERGDDRAPAPPTILQRAPGLAARAALGATEIETTQRLPGDLMRAMRDADLFQMYVRPGVGGPGYDPLVAYLAVEALARGDASAGWLSMVSSTTAWLPGWLPDAVLKEMVGDPCDFRVAGSSKPLGTATSVAGGYRVTGRWDFASGIMHANWVMAGCRVIDGNDAGAVRMMFLPAHEVQIVETWTVVGMRGTGSHDIFASDVFVPEERAALATGTARSPLPLYSQRLLRVCTHGPVAAVTVGAALGAIDDLAAIAEQPTTLNTRQLKQRPEVQRTIADATARVRSARAFIIDNVGAAYEHVSNDRDPTLAVAQSRLAFAHACSESVRAVDEIIRVVGTPAAHLTSPLQRRARDLMVAQHFPSFDIAIHENAGRVLLGLDPEGPGW